MVIPWWDLGNQSFADEGRDSLAGLKRIPTSNEGGGQTTLIAKFNLHPCNADCTLQYSTGYCKIFSSQFLFVAQSTFLSFWAVIDSLHGATLFLWYLHCSRHFPAGRCIAGRSLLKKCIFNIQFLIFSI